MILPFEAGQRLPAARIEEQSGYNHQRAVHVEVLVAQQPFLGFLARLVDDQGEKLFGHRAFQQPVAVLGEDRGVPDRFIRLQADEPAEQQVVFEGSINIR